MKQSNFVTRAEKTVSSEETSKNAILLEQAGFINKLSSGIYSFLPMGLRVIKNIENIIREEMNAVGGQEIFMPALHPKENWEKTGRWEGLKDEMYHLKDKSDREFALGPTHEEIVTPLVQNFIHSYRDLPKSVYQFQSKFRMELRAKAGLLRGREFLMKDMYSFHTTEEDLNAYYDKVTNAYRKIFQRVGLGHITYLTFASGGTFSKFSHEFQTICSTGEDTIYLDENKNIAVNKEVLDDEILKELGIEQENLKEKKAIEVGNIFKLKTKYSEPFKMEFKDEDGSNKTVLMGCYGIGISRIMGTVVEALADDRGLVWPASIAPYKVHLIMLGTKEDTKEKAEDLYKQLNEKGIEVLFDDREASAGEKLAESDLYGIPLRLVVSDRSLAEGMVELKSRTEEKPNMIALDKIVSKLTDENN
ncbi:MAG TPA: His/Gly/Thr/Pro-type tRNA ligase C-terminal domain-containing protein [Candidatus Paceibacterota bacterium]|nr:His/Gly/Thr/Pro-type tRNA ligase C-terminal domain-containing protein [Candidatus Paceibacterota bacterium]